ncbi:unnamed protein product [Moneuplotes crassus]|uniref:RBR-type E3 ubiquitin transferase n=1 Tax=Euplotes crassus TaxID=5936 RepID=A0AAD1UJ47_EUPCR|nr:unnamed protein product [Moneuplotes crassus]
MPNYCIVCYAVKVKKPIQCGAYQGEDHKRKTYVCKQCLTDWATSKLSSDKFAQDHELPCPNSECKHKLTDQDLIQLVGPRLFESINQTYTDIYISTTEDMRRCPSEGCDFAGSIELKACADNLECHKCGFQWREKVQTSYLRRMQEGVTGLIKELDLKSYLNQMLTASACPKCEEVIWKDGGCQHMVCKKCNYEFCWFCLGAYPRYEHTEPMICGHRLALKIWMTIFTLVIFYFKLGFELTLVQIMHSLLWRGVKFIFFYIFLPNFCLFIYALIPPAAVLGAVETYQNWGRLNNKVWQVLLCLFFGFVAFPGTSYLVYISYYSRLNFLHSVLIFELWMIIYIIGFAVACTATFFIAKFLYKVSKTCLLALIKMIRLKGNFIIYAIKTPFQSFSLLRLFVRMNRSEESRYQAVQSIQKSRKRKSNRRGKTKTR